MATNAEWVKVEEEGVATALQEACDKLNGAQAEVVLDFSSVHRLDSAALRAIEQFADTADGCRTKVLLRGVNGDIYKVFKLTNLAARFTFLN